MQPEKTFPVGKLPADFLEQLLKNAPICDPRVLMGPGIGVDCAILDLGQQILVLKSDPITFATEDIGWYAVQVNANDIATTGALPRWMMATLLLPEGQTTPEMVKKISEQLFAACQEIDVSLIGGHTEITHGLDRPILSATMIGEVEPADLILPSTVQTGDCLLLTKGVPIEATAILAREFPNQLTNPENASHLSEDELHQAQNFLYQPGISILKDAQLALRAGQVHAMHDPTEGGLLTALWELARVCGHSISVELDSVHIPTISRRVCEIMRLNPLAAIASGALLMAVQAKDVASICSTLEKAQIHCSQIGKILESNPKPQAWAIKSGQAELLPYPARDEIARLFEK